MTSQAKADVEESEEEIAEIEKDMKEMQANLVEELQELEERYQDTVNQVIEEPVSPYKKNIFIEMFGILWMPYYAFSQKNGWIIVPAFDLSKE
jgi:predicted choloylglycine hydrolase